jgi:hypothetical protein
LSSGIGFQFPGIFSIPLRKGDKAPFTASDMQTILCAINCIGSLAGKLNETRLLFWGYGFEILMASSRLCADGGINL